MADYAKNLEENLNKRATTLSDRLNELDEYRKVNTPEKMFADRPARLDPMKLLDVLINRNQTRTGMENELTNIYSNLYNLTKTTAADKPSFSDMQNAAENGQEWVQDASGKWTLKDLLGGSLTRVTLKGASNTSMQKAKEIYKTAQDAIGKYDTSHIGLGDSLLGLGRMALNVPGVQDEGLLRQSIASIRTTIRNYISGTAVTEYEARELKDLMPKISESNSTVQTKLLGLKQWAINKAQANLDTNNYQNVNAEDYLNFTGAEDTTNTGTKEIPVDEDALDSAILEIRGK